MMTRSMHLRDCGWLELFIMRVQFSGLTFISFWRGKWKYQPNLFLTYISTLPRRWRPKRKSVTTWSVELHVGPLTVFLNCTAALMMRLGEGELPRHVSLFIKMEGGADECGGERMWWVKHLPPEKLHLRPRAPAVNFNYRSRTPPAIWTRAPVSRRCGIFPCVTQMTAM